MQRRGVAPLEHSGKAFSHNPAVDHCDDHPQELRFTKRRSEVAPRQKRLHEIQLFI